MDITIPVTNVGYTRTRPQSDLIIENCHTWLHDQRTRTKKKNANTTIDDIRREFGLKLEPSWYEGWDFDEHRQGFREAEHLFYYGIFRQQLSFFTNSMSTESRRTFIARIDSFQWPDGMPSLAWDFNPKRTKKRWGTDVSMAMYKQLCIAAIFAQDGLIDKRHYEHFVQLWLWHVTILDEHILTDDVPGLQQQGLRIISEGVSLMPDVYDRPNGHGLTELIKRTLPALVYIGLVASGDFERHHRLTKRTNPSRWFIRDAMKSFNIIDTLQLLLHGTRWGRSRDYILGAGLRHLVDPNDPSKPHRLILDITTVLPRPISHKEIPNLYHYNEDWAPYGYECASTNNHQLATMPSPDIYTVLLREATRIGETVTPSHCSWRYPTRIRKWFADGSKRVIRVGHTINCHFPTPLNEGSPASDSDD